MAILIRGNAGEVESLSFPLVFVDRGRPERRWQRTALSQEHLPCLGYYPVAVNLLQPLALCPLLLFTSRVDVFHPLDVYFGPGKKASAPGTVGVLEYKWHWVVKLMGFTARQSVESSTPPPLLASCVPLYELCPLSVPQAFICEIQAVPLSHGNKCEIGKWVALQCSLPGSALPAGKTRKGT